MNMNIDLNKLVSIVILRTLEFSDVQKTEEEIRCFINDLLKDEEFIESLKTMITTNKQGE